MYKINSKILLVSLFLVLIISVIAIIAGFVEEKSKTELRHWCGKKIEKKVHDSVKNKYYFYFEKKFGKSFYELEVDAEEFDRYKEKDVPKCN